MPPDEPDAEERLEQLPEDHDTPFHPADPTNPTDKLDSTHPQTDTNVQPEEAYDEDLSGAAEANEPNMDSAVVDYHPDDTHEKADGPENGAFGPDASGK